MSRTLHCVMLTRPRSSSKILSSGGRVGSVCLVGPVPRQLRYFCLSLQHRGLVQRDPGPDPVGVVILWEQTMHAFFGILEELVFCLYSRSAALFSSMFVWGKVQPQEWVITAWMFVRFSFPLVCSVEGELANQDALLGLFAWSPRQNTASIKDGDIRSCVYFEAVEKLTFFSPPS